MLLQTDPRDKEASAAVIERIGTMIQLFHSHAIRKDKFILPLLRKIDAELATRFKKEHEEDESLSLDLSMLLLSFKNAISPESRQNIWYNTWKTFYAFTAFNLYPMNKEEDEINPLLWVNFSNQEMQAVTKTTLVNIDQVEMLLCNQWVLQGLNNTEIIHWLDVAKGGVPDFFLTYGKLLRQSFRKNVLPQYKMLQPATTVQQRS